LEPLNVMFETRKMDKFNRKRLPVTTGFRKNRKYVLSVVSVKSAYQISAKEKK